ncbi:Calx-beta domain-containing protein [Paenibacillus sp. OV219]|uniref:Calx-beta domain-containing protein n=1 Tax=Paenibacillus sp. OV219 TaxID=1884377 RepID=UPI0008D7010B|nr:Calx-beta domain-containing protein [Paenibacillus sp. OV219]SEO63726.1 Calx-beta domain-containing protein [Paenibacillus sp. OV219]
MVRSTRSIRKVSFLFLVFCTAFALLLPFQASAKAIKPGKFTFAQDHLKVKENAETITITVRRISGKDGEVSVDYCNCSYSAAAGIDFIHVSGTLVFRDGETEKSFTVPIIDDKIKESKEAFLIRLKNPTGGATLDPHYSDYVEIIDND